MPASALIPTALGLLAFAAPAGAVVFRGNDHDALGAAELSVTGASPDALVVSNIGGSGGDGVAIRPADPSVAFQITFEPIDASSFTLAQRARDESAGSSFVITAVKHQASEPVGYETGGNAGDSYSVRFYTGPLKLFESPSVGSGILAESILNPEVAVLTPGASGEAFSIEYILPVPEELFYVPGGQSFTGDRIVIERLEAGGAAAGPPLSMDLIEVTAAELPAFTILDETPGPQPLPVLSLWGCALLGAALLAVGLRKDFRSSTC